MSELAAMKEQVESRLKNHEEETGSGSEGGGPEEMFDSKFLMKCISENVLGDAKIYMALFRDRFVFNKAMNSWMRWCGDYWEIDKISCGALEAVEEVAKVYQNEAMEISNKIRESADDEGIAVATLKADRNALNKRVFALRDPARRKKCLDFVCSSDGALTIEGDEIDQKPYLLPCKNGVINLKTGDLEKGRPGDYLMMASPVEWKGIDTPTPIWDKFLFEIFIGNMKLVMFLQRLIGLGLIGKVIVGIFVVLSGKGRNGKGTIIETITSALSTGLAGAVRSEMLLDQGRMNSSAGPTADIMALRGRRLIFASETDENCRISTSRVKWLTGNDTLSGRNPNDKYEVNFKPTHTLFLQTNNKPHAPADDFAFWERMILIPFTLSYVNREPNDESERRADLSLPEKLEAEYSGILAWMVRGCLEFQKIGLEPPAVVKEAVQEYQRDEDSVADFIDECCVVGPGYSVGATAAYEAFEKWWEKNVSKKVPTQRRFGTFFSRRFGKEKQGTIKYTGVGLLCDPSTEPDKMFQE